MMGVQTPIAPGTRFGALTTLENLTATEAGKHRGAGAQVRVRCYCGVRFTISVRHLRVRKQEDCGGKGHR